MKRFSAKAVLSLALILMLLASLCAPAFATDVGAQVSRQTLTVGGEKKTCEKYAIGGYNYFKLRDLAAMLDGTTSQFDVDYDEVTKNAVITTGVPYTHTNGHELEVGKDNSALAYVSQQTIIIDGEVCEGLSAYNIANHNFFKLRELGEVLHFYVHYDEATDTAEVDAQDEDEDWETGDASLDKVRNADGIGANELLVVSFGTSFNDSRRLTIGAIEQAMEDAFPGYAVRRGFTADTIINHVYKRDDVRIDNLTEALDRAVANGVKYLVVQPTHLMDGYEYNDIIKELANYEGKFDEIAIGNPILTSDEDFQTVIKAVTEATAEQAKEADTAVCFMGHGTSAESNAVYAKIQKLLTDGGYKNYYIGTVEAEPTLQQVVDAVKAAGYKKVYLEPLMIVAGDHANNDMADPEDPESWVSLFKAAGIEATPILRGLGELPAIQELLVEHAKDAMIEGFEENFETGDASKDDPRNTAPDKTKEVLVVSFGTSFNDNRVETIGAIEAAVEKAFPEYAVRRGFTAQIIIDHVYRRDAEVIDNFGQAMDKAVAAGVKELLVVPTHLMNGYEYNDIVKELAEYEGKFEKIAISDPILTSDEDFQTVIKAVTEATAEQAKEADTAVCFMGHGTSAESNAVYAKIQKLLTDGGYKNYYIGTVEAEPTLQQVVDAVKAAGYKKVYLEPLMIVAGDHANNDMADPEDEGSWVSLFKAAGIEATPILKGLGSMPAIQDLLIEHAKAALAGTAAADDSGKTEETEPAEETAKEKVPTEAPTRDPAPADKYSKVKEVVSKTPITADMLNEGVYVLPVKTETKLGKETTTSPMECSSSMIGFREVKLTVKDGKLTAEITMKSDSQPWLFMGTTAQIADAAESELIPLMKDANGTFTFTIELNALDEAFSCATYSKKESMWFDRTMLLQADFLPEGALKA